MKKTGDLPMILLSGDNARTSHNLHRALLDEGFQVQLAPSYSQLESLWQQHRASPDRDTPPPIVLLEVSAPDAVEPAVDAALKLKRRDPLLFIGYLADPALHTSGLAGDAIFPRATEQLAKALRTYFNNQN
jgi:DNA-binding response OmpR family regulator